MKMLLMNVYAYLNQGEKFFSVDKYKIYLQPKSVIKAQDFRNHVQNAYVEFSGHQPESILFKGGIIGSLEKPRKRKFIDDILLIGSLLGGTNWILSSRTGRKYSSSPIISHPYLESIGLQGREKIELLFSTALNVIRNTSWQNQYENGFHCRMLVNRANILNEESRFLSNVVIWEWLYPNLTYPNQSESSDLNKILLSVMKNFWPHMKFTGRNIFHVLRNQLAHSGKLPINRGYAESWMIQLPDNNPFPNPGVKQYLQFFDKLTQVIVLKTLSIDAEKIIQAELSNFLDTGRLSNGE